MGLKMAKNVPNELKFGLDKFENLPKIFWNFKQLIDIHCISMSYLKFQKIFGRFSKLGNFRPKNSNLAHFSRRDSKLFLNGNHINVFKNAQIWLTISILVAYYVTMGLDDFEFWWLHVSSNLPRLLFWSFLAHFVKNPPFA